MHITRDKEAIRSLLSQPLDPELLVRMSLYAAALVEFGPDLSADILIIEAGDTLAKVEQALGARLVADNRFIGPVELITRHDRWFEAVWLYGDEGSGLVAFIEIAGGTNQELIAACEHALAEPLDG